MKTAILCCAIVGGCVASAAAAPTGKVLVLDNESLIEGDIRREGDHYVIQRGAGETIVPAGQVIDLVADRSEAYRLMRERCNRRDYDDRIHLVRWCMENDMRREALDEAEGLLQFRPNDGEIQRLVDGLRTLKTSVAKPVVAAPPAKLPDRVLEVEAPDYNREAFGMFVTKVQPILMNVCARCHASGQGGNYSLISVQGGGDRKATLANLAATLKQIKKSDLSASPLLEKAVAAHGKSVTPPLRDRQSPAYRLLEAWVYNAVVAAPETSEAPQRPTALKPAIPDPAPMPKSLFAENSSTQTIAEPQMEAKDPFDPAIFNGTIQPKKD